MPGLQRGAAWAEERLLGALQQSVPQNGRVHSELNSLYIFQGKHPEFREWPNLEKIF